jgi:hypothetical protein
MIYQTIDEKGDAMKKLKILLPVLVFMLLAANSAFGAIVVGRIAHVEGEIYRYMDGEQSWVETFTRSPAGTQDVLATGNDSRAEIIFPNNVTIRLDENTEVEVLSLDEDSETFILHRGLARFYNRNVTGKLVVETARGSARIEPGSIIDVQVEEGSVAVASLLGEAAFQSFNNDFEKVDVISGSTRLEFREDGIVAGTGAIERKWERWCADREGIWSRNRRVRSKYLPEAMQAYAYALESKGKWRRIYYRGYNYWAWQPRNVSVNWAPYTRGHWYDWQGEPVWIDHNPWGWVTHHYGHWLHLHGTWMWAPYIHISHVPGVTAVGFNITFGKTYRPYWHPGRVRWISHRTHIGWLPLSPWETYYGYRRWGPRSVKVHGGAIFSININLKHHRYVDHAVIIPKHHFHRSGKSVVTNNYNTVKINNINKTVIVNNYKPMTTVKEQRNIKGGTNITKNLKAEKRREVSVKKRTAVTRRVVRVEKNTTRNDLANQKKKQERNKRIIYSKKRKIKSRHAGIIEKKRKIGVKLTAQQRNVRFEQKVHARKIKKQEKMITGRSIVALNKPQRAKEYEVRRLVNKGPERKVSQNNSRIITGQSKKKNILEQNGSRERRSVRNQTRMVQKQVAQIERSSNGNKEKNRKSANGKRKEGKQEKKIAGTGQDSKRQKKYQERQRTRKRAGRNFASASLDTRRFR